MKKSLSSFTALVVIASACVAIAQPVANQSVAPEPIKSASPAAGAAAVTAPLQTAMAASAQNAPTAPDQGGDRLLMQAANQLERRASVAARLRHQVSIPGQKVYYGVGSYWQQGSGDDLKIRLELTIANPDPQLQPSEPQDPKQQDSKPQDSKLLQVCNSRFLWVDRQLPSGRTVTRYDLRQLRADPAVSPSSFDKLDAGKANWSAIQPFLIAHSGGLPSLLISLQENFNFLPPQAMRLTIGSSESSQPMNVPVFAVVGQWKPEKLAALLAKTDDPVQEEAAQKKSKKARPLPERLPQEVLLLVGQADLFPYRIEYRGLETPTTANKEGPPIPYQLSVHPLVVLELSDVVFDAPITAGQFDYTAPADADWVDQTATLIEKLHRQNAAQVATRPASETAVPSR